MTVHKPADSACSVEVQSSPEVEILLATHNGERYLPQQLDSLLCQTYQNWRLIVSDDGSTDSTSIILKDYAQKDSRIAVLPTDKIYGSACANFLSLLGKSTANYVMFCDQDDIWDAEKVSLELSKEIELERECGNKPILVATDLRVVNENLEPISNSFVSFQKLHVEKADIAHLPAQPLLTGCTMIMNRPLVDLAKGCYAPEIRMHDWWVSIIAAAFGEICFVDKATMSYRQHGDNAVGATRYRVTDKIKNLDSVRESVRQSIVQTRFLVRKFSNSLPQDVLIELKKYAELSEISSSEKRIIRFLLSGIRQTSLIRFIGQLYAIATMESMDDLC